MSDSPPPGVAADAAVDPAHALTREAIAEALAEFHGWLTAAALMPLTPDPSPPRGEGRSFGSPLPSGERGRGEGEGGEAAKAVDLHTLLGQFIALRHEVNLQTRAVRAQQEQNGEALQQLSQALDALREAQAAGPQGNQGGEDRLRPLLKTLVDLYDALALAGREMQRVQETVLPALQQVAAAVEPPEAPEEDPPTPAPVRPPGWARWFGWREQQGDAFATWMAEWTARRLREVESRRDLGRQAREGVERVRKTFAALIAGYTMSLQRVDRALAEHGLEPIPAAGAVFDPDWMEAVEAVLDSGRPAGEVVAELRRGYRRDGRVFRYAQVRVARS